MHKSWQLCLSSNQHLLHRNWCAHSGFYPSYTLFPCFTPQQVSQRPSHHCGDHLLFLSQLVPCPDLWSLYTFSCHGSMYTSPALLDPSACALWAFILILGIWREQYMYSSIRSDKILWVCPPFNYYLFLIRRFPWLCRIKLLKDLPVFYLSFGVIWK